MFRDDFKAEVDYLFQLCEELGQREPTLAPILGRGADASVTRLVEGLAFSFGRLRQRLDDDMPEIIHPVVDNLCPEALRPIPSGTIVELTPSPKTMSRQTVPAGSTFASRPVDGTTCFFRSSLDCEVSPWTLRSVEIGTPQRSSVKLVVELFAGTELGAAVPASLRLFLAHPLAAALEARSFLLRCAGRVVVRSLESDGVIVLPAPVALTIGAARDGAETLAASGTAFLALRDYFVFPQSFAFVELPGFDAVAGLDAGTRRLEIEIELTEPVPKGIVFDPSTIRLHAVPALNVFRPAKLVIPLGADKRRCQVTFGEESGSEDAEVYAVERVALVSRGLRSTTLEPWARFFPPRLEGDATAVRYEIHRTPSVLGPRLDVCLSFSAEGVAAFLADKLSAEVEVLATNGVRAAQVGLGDLCLPSATSPSLVSFRNVTSVTRNAAAPVTGDRVWRLFRLLKSNLAALTDTETLASVLALANVPAAEHWPDALPNADRFVALTSVERRRSTTSDRDELRSGAVIRLQLDARRFTGPGDVRLFGEVLAPLFAASVARSEWVELEVVDGAGQLVARYPRLPGTRDGL